MPVKCQISPDDVFDDAGLRTALELKFNTLRVARQNKEIRFFRRAGRVWYSGTHVREWLFGQPIAEEASAESPRKE